MFKIKENAENIAEYRRKNTCFKSFFNLIIFLFSAKSGGGGAKSGGAAALPAPFPPRSLDNLSDGPV